MMKTIAVIEKSVDGIFSVYTKNLELVALNGQGRTVEEAIEDMRVALDEIIEGIKEKGKIVPDNLLKANFEYHYDIASLFESFKMINVSEFARMNGFNESLLRQYKNGLAFASEKQTKKIQKALHQLGQSLIEAKLI